jgi:hypothetical protein
MEMPKRNGCATVGEIMLSKGKAQLDSLEIYKPIDDFDINYLATDEKLKDFMRFCTAAMYRFRHNEEYQARCEADLEDIIHYVELHPLKSAMIGYKIYRKQKELREERRKCKDEAVMMLPLIQMLKEHPEFLSHLETAIKYCDTNKGTLTNRKYKLRGTVLQEMGLCQDSTF